ncbi:MAG: M48 family peptidase [Nitrospirae bacterium]|nr:MAG: M48 family peptidase [Nitrospirota bacterium]
MDALQQYKLVLLTAYLLVQGFSYWLELLNLRHMKTHGHEIPQGFEEYTDATSMKRTMAYTAEKTALDLAESAWDSILLLIILYGGLLDRYSAWILSLQLPFVASGVIFFLLIQYMGMAASVPFSLYGTFRLENRYGFNTMTPRLWGTDLLKSAVLATVLTGILTAAGLWLVQLSPELWWLYVWGLFLAFSIFLMYVSPYVIEPLFNTFTPLEGGPLTLRITELMNKAGLRVSSVQKIDASKRSRHTNAYFTGIGKVKRIVMFDTLLEKMTDDEILAILAHEVGHWKKRHILKRIVTLEAVALAGMYLSYLALRGDLLSRMFVPSAGTFYAKIIALGFIAGIITFPFTALSSYISRRHEEEADRFAAGLTGDPESLATSLIKLSKDNLSNLHPHPLYADFYYSHPPVVDRIAKIRSGPAD